MRKSHVGELLEDAVLLNGGRVRVGCVLDETIVDQRRRVIPILDHITDDVRLAFQIFKERGKRLSARRA